MPVKKNTAGGYELLVSELKKNPEADYAALKAKAEKKGLTIYPVMYGRAKASLGLVKTAPRGQGKAARRKATAARQADHPAAVAKRGPGRPRKDAQRPATNGSMVDAVSTLVASVRATERDNAALRSTLGRLRDLIDRAL